jgi:hypothetical protein
VVLSSVVALVLRGCVVFRCGGVLRAWFPLLPYLFWFGDYFFLSTFS